MKQILLTQGKVALVDDEDFERVNQYKWHTYFDKTNCYAERKETVNGIRVKVKMHRFIMNAKENEVIDHRDNNGLNNQKENLRPCTTAENNRNLSAYGISAYKGVTITERNCKAKDGSVKQYKYFRARITINGKSVSLGLFKSEIEAAKAYNEAAVKFHGEFANLNVISGEAPSVLIAEFDSDVNAMIVSKTSN